MTKFCTFTERFIKKQYLKYTKFPAIKSLNPLPRGSQLHGDPVTRDPNRVRTLKLRL